MNRALVIRAIEATEFRIVWPPFRSVVAAGDTYSDPPDLSQDDAQALWTTPPSRTFVAERDGHAALGPADIHTMHRTL